jgi:transposase InsO family protein
VACAAHPWRAENAGHRDFRANGISHSATATPATQSELEDLSSQSSKSDGLDRFLHRAHGHPESAVCVDFFTVPTVTLKVLFVFFVLEHRRRQVLHFNVTEHPTGAWTAQQIVEAFEDRDAARYLLRDRDSIYGHNVRVRIASLGSKEVLTAPRSPWQNPYAERLIGSIRRECLNHFVILNAKHLKRTLTKYFRYYHESRTHLGLGKQCPVPRSVSSSGKIIEIPLLGGLHHRYERIAA